MSYGILKNGQASERANGLRFIEIFENASEVAKNEGTIIGNPTINNEAIFNGSSTISYNVPSFDGVFTIDFDVVLSSKTGDQFLIEKRIGFAEGFEISYVAATDNFRFLIDVGGAAISTAGSIHPIINKKYHISAVYDGSNIRLYIDGVLDAPNFPASGSHKNNSPLYIGSDSSSTSFLTGKISNVRYFTEILSVEDMKKYKNNSTFNYKDKAVLNLPMGMAQHDPSYIDTTDLIINGDFSADTDWNKNTGWTIANGKAIYDGTGGTSSIGTSENTSVVVGKRYKISLDVISNQGSGANTIFLNAQLINSAHLDAGTHEFIFTATHTGKWSIYGRSGEVFEIDNVSITEYKPRTLDVSGKGNHATLGEGTVSAMPTKLTERHGYSFDGSNDYMDLSEMASEINSFTNTTIAFVVSPDSLNYDQIFFKASNGSEPSSYVQIYMDSVNRYKFLIKENGSTIANLPTVNPFPKNVITTVIVTVGDNGSCIYIDGKLNYSITTKKSFNDVDGIDFVSIGAGKSGGTVGGFWHGKVFDGILLDKTLSPIQVLDLHNNLMKKFNRK